MVILNDIDKIVQSIPAILQYFIPGFIGLKIISKLTAKKFENDYVFILSCVYSYVFISLIGLLNAWIKSPILENALVVSAIAITLCIIVSCVFSLIIKSPKAKRSMLKIFHRTLNDDIWLDVLNYEVGANLKVYLKDKNYFIIGQYRLNEEKGEDSWFALSGYAKCDIKTNDIIPTANYLNNKNVFITFRLKDVEHIEVFNN